MNRNWYWKSFLVFDEPPDFFFNNAEPWLYRTFFWFVLFLVKLLPCHFSYLQCTVVTEMRNPAGTRGHIRPPRPEPDLPCCHDDSPLCRGHRRELECSPEEENEGRRVGGTRRLPLSPLSTSASFEIQIGERSGCLWFIIPLLAPCKVQVIFKKHCKKKCVCISSLQSRELVSCQTDEAKWR